jgi:hypothetical protein
VKYRLAKFLAIPSQTPRSKKKSRHNRPAFKLSASTHFHIREQARGSTALNRNKRTASAGEVTRYESQQERSANVELVWPFHSG